MFEKFQPVHLSQIFCSYLCFQYISVCVVIVVFSFTLNTFASIEYDATHREKVCTLKFRPAGHPLAVTICPEEKIFKLWCVVEDDRG